MTFRRHPSLLSSEFDSLFTGDTPLQADDNMDDYLALVAEYPEGITRLRGQG